ncbi:unnamed protein product [Cylicocyclus nassatus]|uniref:Uncharacterized protein n=1 Tax=Cylicocyclus nassatus TaxID=53992 RepID=A0AA36H8Y2_CYLNA|nr:unnamed protein product [Cylicocyclus nassatus]
MKTFVKDVIAIKSPLKSVSFICTATLPHNDSLDDESRSVLRREDRNLYKTMCFGAFAFIIILCVIVVIIVVAAAPSRKRTQEGFREAPQPVHIRIPQYDVPRTEDEENAPNVESVDMEVPRYDALENDGEDSDVLVEE